MKNLIFLLAVILSISGCYTMITHPQVEIYYERENGEEYLSEDYDVFVDEDCTTCHDSFIAQKHFAPLIPAHDYSSNWNDLPWWLDTKYLMFFSENDGDSSSSAGYNYQHVNSQSRPNLPLSQQGGYVTRSGGSTSGSDNTINMSGNNSSNSGSNSAVRSRSGSSNDNSSNNSRSSSSSSKRKFRKRK